jgi:hypothetical protein
MTGIAACLSEVQVWSPVLCLTRPAPPAVPADHFVHGFLSFHEGLSTVSGIAWA